MTLQRGHVGFATDFFQRAPAPVNVALQALGQLRFRQPLRLLRGYAVQRMLINAQGLAGQEPFTGGVDMGMNADPPQAGNAGCIAGGDDFQPIVPNPAPPPVLPAVHRRRAAPVPHAAK